MSQFITVKTEDKILDHNIHSNTKVFVLLPQRYSTNIDDGYNDYFRRKCSNDVYEYYKTIIESKRRSILGTYREKWDSRNGVSVLHAFVYDKTDYYNRYRLSEGSADEVLESINSYLSKVARDINSDPENEHYTVVLRVPIGAGATSDSDWDTFVEIMMAKLTSNYTVEFHALSRQQLNWTKDFEELEAKEKARKAAQAERDAEDYRERENFRRFIESVHPNHRETAAILWNVWGGIDY